MVNNMTQDEQELAAVEGDTGKPMNREDKMKLIKADLGVDGEIKMEKGQEESEGLTSDKITKIQNDLGLNPKKPETTQPDIHDDREEDDDGATATKNKDINTQYDYFCPIHRTVVSGNICPGGGGMGKHQIDERWAIPREQVGEKKAGKMMAGDDLETGLGDPDVQKALNAPGDRRSRIAAIQKDLGIIAKPRKQGMEKAVKDVVDAPARNDNQKKANELAKSLLVTFANVTNHVSKLKDTIGEKQADKMLDEIQKLEQHMTVGLDRFAKGDASGQRIISKGIAIIKDLVKSLPQPKVFIEEPKKRTISKAIGAERAVHKYIRREDKPGGGHSYFYKDAQGKEYEGTKPGPAVKPGDSLGLTSTHRLPMRIEPKAKQAETGKPMAEKTQAEKAEAIKKEIGAAKPEAKIKASSIKADNVKDIMKELEGRKDVMDYIKGHSLTGDTLEAIATKISQDKDVDLTDYVEQSF